MNNRGVMGLIILFLIIFTILIVGFIGTMAISIIDYGSDELTPILTDLGVIEDGDISVNMSDIGTKTFGVLDTLVQTLPWLFGLVYGCALIFTLVFVVGYKTSPHPVFLGFYFALMLLLIFGSIVISNMYQDIYTGTDEIATRLQEQTMMSYMMLYAPHIMTLIAAVAGIFMFTRSPGDSGGGIDI